MGEPEEASSEEEKDGAMDQEDAEGEKPTNTKDEL